jgi:hypothetical protein
VARDLRLLPRRQPGIGVAHQFVRFGLQPRDLRIDIERTVGRLAQFVDSALQLGDGFFKVEKTWHVLWMIPVIRWGCS